MKSVLFVLFVLVAHSTLCLAHKESGSFDLGSYAKVFQFSGFSVLSYTFKIQSGTGALSVYLLDEENYNLYSSNSNAFTYYQEGSDLYTSTAKEEDVDISKSSTYWLVIENENADTQTIEYSLSLTTKGPTAWLLVLVPITIVSVCIVGMVVVYKLYARRITKIVQSNDKFYFQLEEEEKGTEQNVELDSTQEVRS